MLMKQRGRGKGRLLAEAQPGTEWRPRTQVVDRATPG
jgi:hypothetical protein